MNGAAENVAKQLTEELHARLWPLGSLMGEDLIEMATDAPRLRLAARRLAAQLLDDRRDGGDPFGIDPDSIAAETAQDVMCGLWPVGDPPAEWWHTPVGRAVARSYGIEGSEGVSASVAAAMLGTSRAWVYRLLDAGKLDRHPDGGVVRASVMMRLAGCADEERPAES
jgi:hypothetical protein